MLIIIIINQTQYGFVSHTSTVNLLEVITMIYKIFKW